jgi:hypothetical protein
MEPSEKFREDALKWISFLSERGTVYIGGGLQTKPLITGSNSLLKMFHLKGFNIAIKILDSVLPVTRKSDKRILNFFNNYAESLFDQ